LKAHKSEGKFLLKFSKPAIVPKYYKKSIIYYIASVRLINFAAKFKIFAGLKRWSYKRCNIKNSLTLFN